MIHLNRGATSLGIFSEEEIREGLAQRPLRPRRYGVARRNGELAAALAVFRIRSIRRAASASWSAINKPYCYTSDSCR
jgi:hypothetical protein